jgi:phage terminase large subunit
MIENIGSGEGEIGSITEAPQVVKQVGLFDNEPNPLYYANLMATERIVVNQGGTFCVGGEMTVVVRGHGTKRIMDIEIGEQVLSWDEVNEVSEWCDVVDVMKYRCDKRVIRWKGLVATFDHLFWKYGRWMTMEELADGQGEDIKLQYVWDISVRGNHNYMIIADDVMYWSHNSSKSYSIMQVLATIACSQLNVDIIIAGSTVPKLKEDVMKIMAQLVMGNKNLRKFVKSFNIQDRKYVFTTGSTMEFKSYEDAEMAKGGKHHYLYVSEATRFDYATFDILNRNTSIRTWVDYNPTFRFWVHDIVLTNKVQYPSTRMIRSWHEHNRYISQDKHDEIERISDKDMWRVYARGLTGKLSGLVYSWAEIEEFPMVGVREVIWGIDWGYTNDPTALTKIACMEDGTYVVEELTYTAGIHEDVLTHIMKENGYSTEQAVYCDHDKDMVYRMRLNGVMALPAEKGAGSILNGVLYVKQKTVRYTKRSRNLAMELGKYRFVEIDGQNTNKVVDEFNHVLDSCRMALYSHRYRGGMGSSGD